MVPDVALLTIFDFYMDEEKIETWQTLVHVCRKWRNIVFGSPRRLNLRLFCTARTLRRRKLDIWPLLPIVLRSDDYIWRVGHFMVVLEHTDRVCEIDLSNMTSPQMEEVLVAMQQPFPALTRLRLQLAYPEPVVSASESILGGSAPGLQALCLCRVPFPGLPKLLLSATHLVDLRLLDIPHSGYITPEAMVNSLSVLTKLEIFKISFGSLRSRPPPKSRHQFSQTLTLLPALTGLWFGGYHQYFEDLVAQIDVPLLDELYISLSTSHTPKLAPFIGRIPKSKAPNEAHVLFSKEDVVIRFPRTFDGAVRLEVSCEEPNRQRLWMARLCSSSLPQSLISVVENLYIKTEEERKLDWMLLDDETEKSQWLELLRPFTSVKCLYIAYGFKRCLARAVEGLTGERVTEVFPALQTLFLEEDPFHDGRFQEAIGPFVAARQLSGYPIVVSHWDEK